MKFKKDGKVYELPEVKDTVCDKAKDCKSCKAMIAAKAFGIPCPDIWNRFPRGTSALCGYEVIEDNTPDIAEVVEKHGEDVKPKRRTLGVSNPTDDIAEAVEKYLEAVKPRKLTRVDILHKAEKCVCGQREQDYGTPEDNFTTIAELWEAYIRAACTSENADVCVDAKDVAAMMALMKIARIAAGNGKADNWVDLAGYAACGAECEGVEA